MIANTFGGQVVWSFVSQFEVAEGILIVETVFLCGLALEYLGFGSLLNHRLFRGHVRSPLSRMCTLLAALGALSFDLLAMCNFKRLDRVIDIHGWNLVQYPLRVLGYIGGSAMGQDGRLGYGVLALMVWTFTLIALSLGAGLARAVKFFALPSMLFLTTLVFLFDPGQMDIQAINVASGLTYDGISLLSNWSLLTVSLALTLFFALRGMGRRASVRARRSSPLAPLVRAVRAASRGQEQSRPGTSNLNPGTN